MKENSAYLLDEPIRDREAGVNNHVGQIGERCIAFSGQIFQNDQAGTQSPADDLTPPVSG